MRRKSRRFMEGAEDEMNFLGIGKDLMVLNLNTEANFDSFAEPQ